MAKADFSKLQQRSKQSFSAQRELIKKLGRGETVTCHSCGQPLQLNVSKTGQPGVSCASGCTQIELELG